MDLPIQTDTKSRDWTTQNYRWSEGPSLAESCFEDRIVQHPWHSPAVVPCALSPVYRLHTESATVRKDASDPAKHESSHTETHPQGKTGTRCQTYNLKRHSNSKNALLKRQLHNLSASQLQNHCDEETFFS